VAVELEIMQQARMTLAKSPPGTTLDLQKNWPRKSPQWPMESMEWIFPKAWVFDGKKCQKSTERHFKLGHSRGLIVDATLEASGAPIHELNGALGLDGCNSRVHILWHHIS